MSLKDTLLGLLNQSSVHYLDHAVPPGRVVPGGRDRVAASGRHYLRLWLAEMFLVQKRRWGQDLFPAVHSLVTFQFGDKVVRIPGVADAARAGLVQDAAGALLARDFALTPLLPFNGGTVELAVALQAVPGENHLSTFIATLSGFSRLLCVPQLSAAMDVAGPLTEGVQSLLGCGGGVHLGLFATMVGAGSTAPGQLAEGYRAVVRATAQQVDPASLAVKEGRLLSDGAPLQDVDYLLLYLELVEDRDDWAKLTAIHDPILAADEALALGEEDRAATLMRAAMLAAYRSPDLTVADRRRVVDRIKAHFQQARNDLLGGAGLLPDQGPAGLPGAMRGAMSPGAALQLGEPTLDDLF